jgi:aminocarboxymuconate-semialdehyde decarboxylase
VPTVDVHTHILPSELPRWSQRFGYGGFIRLDHHRPCCARMMRDDGTFFREVDDNCWSARRRLEQCDAAGVDVQVLSTVPVMFHYWTEPAHAAETSRFLNDHIAAVVAEHPTRFVGLGTVPLQSTDLAIRELERLHGELGLRGIQIGTHVQGRNLDDEALFPVFARAADLGLAVFVHPWDMLGGERLSRYWMPWLVGMPAELAVAMCSMIFGGVLERLPSLRVCFAHGGGAFPGVFGRIAHGFEARPDLCATRNPHPPSRYLSRIYVDSLVHDRRQLQVILDLFGADRIALGSDYPFPLGESHPGQLIRACGLTPEVEHRLLGGTAFEWLGLEAR